MTMTSAPDSDDFIVAHEVLSYLLENFKLEAEINHDSMTACQQVDMWYWLTSLNMAMDLVMLEIQRLTKTEP